MTTQLGVTQLRTVRHVREEQSKTSRLRQPKLVLTSAALARLPKEPAAFIQPMQPELVKNLPSGDKWRYELKWDGYRAIAVKRGDEVTLYSRNRTNLTSKYPAAVQQLRRLASSELVVDGEIVVVDSQGRPSFQSLQNYSAKNGSALLFIAFDLLNYEGRSLLALPLSERLELLGKRAAPADLRVSESLEADADSVIEDVRTLGLEGVVAKHRSSKYEPGVRGRTWFKYRIGLSQGIRDWRVHAWRAVSLLAGRILRHR